MLVELIWGEIVERLVEAPGFVAVVPGDEGVLEPAEVGGQIVDVKRVNGAQPLSVFTQAIDDLLKDGGAAKAERD